MLLLSLLVGVATAALPDACLTKEFESNGRFTGQNIDMNYDETMMLTDSGATKLRVQFFVPRRYVEQYAANAFTISFNRDMEATVSESGDSFENAVGQFVGQKNNVQKACYSNRYSNYTYCKMEDKADDAPEWTIETNDDNECISDAYVTIDWADVMGDAFGNPEPRDNGNNLEIFLKATVETWTHFREGDEDDYYGVMTGAEQWLNKDEEDGDTNKKGRYGGDGGWQGAGDPHSGDFGPIVIDDERYTLYQIPFILRFPKTVQVSADFQTAAEVTTLRGVVGQDVINLQMNPDSGVAAVLEVVLATKVQFPYGIRGPNGDDPAGITVVVGGRDGNGDHAESVEFVEYDDAGACGDNEEGEFCDQTFKIRITPNADNPCTVEGDYTFEFWVMCVNTGEKQLNGGCTLDDLVDSDQLEDRRNSNAYAFETISIQHQPFCPVLVDEVRVVGDLRVFHDEEFETAIESDSVFTNDILFYEAAYRTASGKATDDFTDFESNDFDDSDEVVGDDSIIDFVRATKVFMDVTIGLDSDGNPTEDWNGEDFDDNFDFRGPSESGNQLGETRIPGTDITDDWLTMKQESGNAAQYNIVLCQVDPLDAEYIVWDKSQFTNCFTEENAQSDIALKYLDFIEVENSKEGDNPIDENEIAFAMRMDERIIPLKPRATDGSFVKITVQAEVYYKGNRQPTRRLLQADPAPRGDRRQQHTMNTSYSVFARETLAKCNVGDDETQGRLELHLTYENAEDMPEVNASLDWSASLSAGLNDFLGLDRAVTVAKVSRCDEDGNCSAIYMESRQPMRRLEGAAYLKVELKVAGNMEYSAGHILNRLQDHVINRRSPIHKDVSVLAKATVSRMEVPNCGEHVDAPVSPRQALESVKSERPLLDEESSAAVASTLVAALVGLFALL